MPSEVYEFRKPDPAVFAQPSKRQIALAEHKIAAAIVASIYYSRHGDSPFTVETIMAAAALNDELLAVLSKIAPDRFGSLSKNMLTRWFTAQELSLSHSDSLYRVERVSKVAHIWRYVPRDAAPAPAPEDV